MLHVTSICSYLSCHSNNKFMEWNSRIRMKLTAILCAAVVSLCSSHILFAPVIFCSPFISCVLQWYPVCSSNIIYFPVTFCILQSYPVRSSKVLYVSGISYMFQSHLHIPQAWNFYQHRSENMKSALSNMKTTRIYYFLLLILYHWAGIA
jgi:hypothetical protein